MRTGHTDSAAGSKSGDGLAVAVVASAQVAGRVQSELVCGSHAGCTLH